MSLTPTYWCPCERGRVETCAHREGRVEMTAASWAEEPQDRQRPGRGPVQSPPRASAGAGFAAALMWDFWSPGLGDCKFLCIKPPVCGFNVEAPGNAAPADSRRDSVRGTGRFPGARSLCLENEEGPPSRAVGCRAHRRCSPNAETVKKTECVPRNVTHSLAMWENVTVPLLS